MEEGATITITPQEGDTGMVADQDTALATATVEMVAIFRLGASEALVLVLDFHFIRLLEVAMATAVEEALMQVLVLVQVLLANLLTC